MPYRQDEVRELRDNKIRQLLGELAPIWLVKDAFHPREDSVLFALVFQDPSYGWMERHYKYDAFNDILYMMGWRLLSEEEIGKILETEPYVPGDLAVHVPNAPAHRFNDVVNNAR
jgi:hypothetical protein